MLSTQKINEEVTLIELCMKGRTSWALEPYEPLHFQRQSWAYPSVDSSVLVFSQLLQWVACFIPVDSETFGPQNISQSFIIIANICYSILCVYLKYTHHPLKCLCLDLLLNVVHDKPRRKCWHASNLQATGFIGALKLSALGLLRDSEILQVLRISVRGHLLEEKHHFLCPVVHLSQVIHSVMY